MTEPDYELERLLVERAVDRKMRDVAALRPSAYSAERLRAIVRYIEKSGGEDPDLVLAVAPCAGAAAAGSESA